MKSVFKFSLIVAIALGWSGMQAHAVNVYVHPTTFTYLTHTTGVGETVIDWIEGNNRIYMVGTFSSIFVYADWPQNPQPAALANNGCNNIGYYLYTPGGSHPHIVNPMGGGVNGAITGDSISGDDITISGSFTQVGGNSGFNGTAKWSHANSLWYPGIRIEKINDAVEGGTYGKFRIHRMGSTASSLVTKFTVGGTANGSDYSLYVNGGPETWGQATIASGASYATIDIVGVTDGASDPNETVILTLSTDSAYVIGTPSVATVTIAEPPTVSIEWIDNAVEGGNYGTFRIHRTGSTTSSLVTKFSVGGTANGSDYSLYVNGGPEPGNQATIASGATYATVDIVAFTDGVSDNNETVILTLSSDSAYVIGSPNTATVTITQ